MNYLDVLECSHCEARYAARQLINVCQNCGYPLLVRYDLEQASRDLDREKIASRPRGLWQFSELLPVQDQAHQLSLGEGGKPVLPLNRLGKHLDLDFLYVKDEGQNPTGSFKALGLAVAVSRAIELGATEFVIPTAGNAGGALSAYAARAGVPAHVYMPKDASPIHILEVKMTGADLHLVDGLIDSAGSAAAADAKKAGWFNVSTLKEPYRLEGKKIMGYELAIAFGWKLPDVIIYPTGGGTGLIGMWKAFEEMESLGWITGRRPRMVAVQADGCAPIVHAYQEGLDEAVPWPDARTDAGGLRVPVALGSRLMLKAIRESGGTAIAVSDEKIHQAQMLLAKSEGIFPCLEGAATIAALSALTELGWILPEERVVVFNTGSGLKHRLSPDT